MNHRLVSTRADYQAESIGRRCYSQSEAKWTDANGLCWTNTEKD